MERVEKDKDNGNRKEIPYEEMKIGRVLQLWEKGYQSECDGNRKVIEISYCF